MPMRVRFTPFDIVVINDAVQMKRLDDERVISRELLPAGGWLHRILHERIYGTLTVDRIPLPAFLGRDDKERARTRRPSSFGSADTTTRRSTPMPCGLLPLDR